MDVIVSDFYMEWFPWVEKKLVNEKKIIQKGTYIGTGHKELKIAFNQ